MQQFNEMIVGFLRGTSLADVMSRRLKLSLHVAREDDAPHDERLLALTRRAGQTPVPAFTRNHLLVSHQP
jgi:hypothetical protein